MKNKFLQFFRYISHGAVIFALLTGVVLAQGGSIVHQPVYQHQPSEPLVLYAMVSADQEVENVRILFRSEGETGFIERYMELYDDVWRIQITPEYFKGQQFEYFMAADLVNYELLTYPANDPEGAPVQVRLDTPGVTELIPGTAGTQVSARVTGVGKGEILIFSPDPESTVPQNEVYIAASLYNVEAVDPSTIRLRVDGLDVSKQADISVDLVAYSPMTLTPGRHYIQINAKNASGQSIPGKGWYFIVAGESAKDKRGSSPITYRGKVNGSYSRDPQGGGNYLDIYKTNASFVGSYNNISLKADVRLTSDEDPYKQPKNRLRINAGVGNWLNLDFGDFSSRHSKYTLDGKRVRGISADLTTGWVNLHVVKGELARSIDGRTDTDLAYTGTLITETDELDSAVTNTIFKLDRKGYTFQRDVFSARLSFGSGRWAQWGVNVLKAKDNINSVNRDISDALITIPETEIYDSDSTLLAAMEGGVFEHRNLDEVNIAAYSPLQYIY